MDITCTVAKQYSRVLDVFGYLIRNALMLNSKIKAQYWNQVQDDLSKLPTDYAIIMFSDGELHKYTLDRNSYKQNAVIVIELVSAKDNVAIFSETYNNLALLFHNQFSEYNIQVDRVYKSQKPTVRGHLFTITVEYNFILEKC